MKTSPIVLILMLGLVVSAGCAKPDWIQDTLVTVDVTGVWIGNSARTGGGSTTAVEARFELEQHGTKVTGKVRLVGAGTSGTLANTSGSIEGTVGGDVFTFRQPDGPLSGEMRAVGEHEMSGFVSVPSRVPFSLRRIDSSPPPRSQ